MAKIPLKPWIAGYEVTVKPTPEPKYGIWMNVDYNKLGKRPKVDQKLWAIQQIRTLVAKSRARMLTPDQIMAQIREIMSKVSD